MSYSSGTDSSLFSALKTASVINSQHIAIDGDSASVTYGELFEKVDRLATALKSYQVRSVALLADNSADWIAIDLACLSLNICCIPLPTFFSATQIRHTLTVAGVDAIVCADAQALPDIPDVILNPWVLPDSSLSIVQLLYDAPPPIYRQVRERLSKADISKITFTSGSTGQPKGVCLTQAHMAAVTLALHDRLASLQLGNHISVLPYATLLENIAGIYLSLLRGAAIIVPDMTALGLTGSSQIASEAFLKILGQYDFETAILVPQQLKYLLDGINAGHTSPRRARFIAVGGGKIPMPWIQQARSLSLPVYEGYGLSECGSVVSLNIPGEFRDGTAGRALPHVSVTTDNGELRVHSVHQARYLPDLVGSHALVEHPASTPIATGDLGHVDGDGYVHVTGRKKNVLINSFGRNISPEWVETELLASDHIQQCVVLGDGRPYCVALIVPANPSANYEKIDEHVRTANLDLPDYARVHVWHPISTPFSIDNGLLTANGRIKRDQVATEYDSEIDTLFAASSAITRLTGGM